jgi:hypothetical protein
MYMLAPGITHMTYLYDPLILCVIGPLVMMPRPLRQSQNTRVLVHAGRVPVTRHP